MSHEEPTAKDALIEAAKRYGKIDPAGYFGQESQIAKRLAVVGLIELLGKEDPMRDVLRQYQAFETSSLPVMLSEDRCWAMEAAIDDYRAAAEAKADQMAEELAAIRDQLGLSD